MAVKSTTKPSPAPAATKGSSLSSILAGAAKKWDQTVEAAEKSSAYPDLEDGTYIQLLKTFEIKESDAGNWGVTFGWRTLEPEESLNVWKYEWVALMDYEDPTALSKYIVQRLKNFADTPAKDLNPTKIEQIFQDAVDQQQVWKNRLKTGKDKGDGQEPRQYLYMLSRVDGYDIPDSDDEDTEDAVDEPLEKGTEVRWSVSTGTGRKKTTEEKTGTVWSYDEDSETYSVKVGGTAKKPILEEVAAAIIEEVEPEVEEEEEEETHEEGEVEYTEGEEVTFTVDGEELTGVILAVDDQTETLDVEVTTGSGRKAKKTTYEVSFDDVVSDDEEATEEEEEEEVDIEVGNPVEFVDPASKKKLTGKVVKVDVEGQLADIKVGAVTKKGISWEIISVLVEK